MIKDADVNEFRIVMKMIILMMVKIVMMRIIVMKMIMAMITIIVITAGNNLSVGWHRVEAAAEDDPSPLGRPNPATPVCPHRIFQTP